MRPLTDAKILNVAGGYNDIDDKRAIAASKDPYYPKPLIITNPTKYLALEVLLKQFMICTKVAHSILSSSLLPTALNYS